MTPTTVRTDLALRGGLRLPDSADFPPDAKVGATCLRAGAMYVRTDVGGVSAWLPVSSPQSHYVQSQGVAAQVWEVAHGFSGDAVSILAYDPSGNVMPATVANSEGMASVDVGTARTGYVVVFGLAFDTRGTAASLLGVHGASGDHDARYYTKSQANQSLSGKLDATATAADSDKLDGQNATAFASAGQGGRADTAAQPGQLNRLRLADEGSYASGSAGVNIDDAVAGDFGLYSNGNPGTFPSDGGSFWFISTQAIYSGDALLQTANSYNGDNDVRLPSIAYRLLNNNAESWTEWVMLWHSGNLDPSAFASAGHAHDYLPRTGIAKDSQKLAGKPASDYLTVNDRIDLGEL